MSHLTIEHADHISVHFGDPADPAQGDIVRRLPNLPVVHGTAQRGEQHPRAKLTKEQVLAIRADGRRLGAIAADYGISESHASAIRNKQTWRHV